MELYYRIVKMNIHQKVNIKVIETLGYLSYNIKKVQNVSNFACYFPYFSDYLLSNNYLNRLILIAVNFNFNKEDDLIDYYINFLKSISLKIKDNPVQLFYNTVTHQKRPNSPRTTPNFR